MSMKTTEPKFWTEGRRRYKAVAEYGMDEVFARRHNQEPHFSVTWSYYVGGVGGAWHDQGGGAAHEEIGKRWPALRPYLKWHLVSPSGPMHYVENAVYHAQLAAGRSKWEKRAGENPVAAFKHTVVWGAVPEADVGEPWAVLSDDELRVWLKGRLPALRAAFKHDMQALGVWEE